MRIYYLIESSTVELEVIPPTVLLFTDLREAVEAYNQHKKDAIIDLDDGIQDADEDDIANGVASWCIYEESRYAENHIHVQLNYQDI